MFYQNGFSILKFHYITSNMSFQSNFSIVNLLLATYVPVARHLVRCLILLRVFEDLNRLTQWCIIQIKHFGVNFDMELIMGHTNQSTSVYVCIYGYIYAYLLWIAQNIFLSNLVLSYSMEMIIYLQGCGAEMRWNWVNILAVNVVTNKLSKPQPFHVLMEASEVLDCQYPSVDAQTENFKFFHITY